MDASVSPFAFLLPIRLWDVSDEHRKLMLNAAVNSVLMVSHKACTRESKTEFDRGQTGHFQRSYVLVSSVGM